MFLEFLKTAHLHTPSQQIGMAIMACVGLYAAVRGGRIERLGAALMLGAWILTPFLVDLAPSGLDAVAVLAIDAGLLAALFALALFGDRYWPLASAAFHLVGTVLHIAQFVDPEVALRERIVATYIFSYMTILALAVGVALEGRRRDAP